MPEKAKSFFIIASVYFENIDLSIQEPCIGYTVRDLYSWLESHNGFTPLTTSISSSSSSSNNTKLNH
jgi:hypothetical protein